MGLPSGMLAYKLLKQTGLSESHEQLARTTVSELTFENMKLQLKKIFGDITELPLLESVKVEPLMQATHTQRYNAPEETTMDKAIAIGDHIEERVIFMGNREIFMDNRTIFAVTEAINIINLSIEAIPSMTVQLVAVLTKVLNLQMADS